jgi:hypothetical protein
MKAFLLALLLSCAVWAQPTKVLKKYGHTLDGKPVAQAFTVAQAFNGPADYHYQQCSLKVGLDMKPYRGQKATLWKCRLKRKSRDGYPIYAVLVYQGEKLIGAWMCTDAPIAPGLVPISSQDFGKDF